MAVLERLKAMDLSFTFQEIAKASGVHVATIYARWPDRASLLMAAYDEHARKLDIEFSGDWEADMHRIGAALRTFLQDPVELATNTMLAASGDAEYREQVTRHFTPLLTELAAPLKAAKKKGLVRADADPELVVGMLTSFILSLILFTGQVPDDRALKNMVDHLIRSCKA